jgi:hypothetical protein
MFIKVQFYFLLKNNSNNDYFFQKLVAVTKLAYGHRCIGGERGEKGGTSFTPSKDFEQL